MKYATTIKDDYFALNYSKGNILLRWGIAVITGIVGLLLIGSWAIKLPETVNSTIVISGRNVPANVAARRNGTLILFVRDGDSVGGGSILGAIDNPARIEDVIRLKEYLRNINHVALSVPLFDTLELRTNLRLGQLQSYYTSLSQLHNDFIFFRKQGFYKKEIEGLNNQASSYRKLEEQLTSQKEYLEQEVAILKDQHLKQEELFRKGFLSKDELSISEKEYLSGKISLANLKATIIQNNVQITSCEREAERVLMATSRETHNHLMALGAALLNLKTQIELWEQEFVIKSPIDGVISLFKYWANNEVVEQGSTVATVIPFNRKVNGKIQLGQSRTGKIHPGNEVRIKVSSYPFQEYGIVVGVVESISQMSLEGQFLITVEFPKGLVTTYGRELRLLNGMQGSAEIVTEDLRLLERILTPLRAIIRNNVKL